MTTFLSGPAHWGDNDPVTQVRVADVLHGDQLTIQIVGDLDWSTTSAVHDHLHAMITTRAAAHIIVDLTGVDFCDTAAVRALTRLAEAAAGDGATFRLRGARVHVAWLCDQLGAGHLMSPRPSP